MRYGPLAARTAFYSHVLSNVRSLPGVSSAAYISFIPMGPTGGGIWPIAPTGAAAEDSAGPAKTAAIRVVSPDYFKTMGIPLRTGRDVAESDTVEAAPVAVVSVSFARRYWPNQNPIGQTFHFAFNNFPFAEQDRTVVGVVGDVRFRGLERQSEPQVYLAYRQLPDNTSTFYSPKDLVIRASADAAALMPSIREIIRSADPELPVSAVRSMQEVIDLQTAPRSMQLRLVALFAGLASALAGIGIHGLLSFTVGQRSSEFGLRIALGARSNEIMSMVLREGAVLSLAGAALGIVIAFGTGYRMRAILAGIGPFDPTTAGTAAFVILVTTVSGCLLPAWRAMRTDPAAIVRGE
jgi:predicted permease